MCFRLLAHNFNNKNGILRELDVCIFEINANTSHIILCNFAIFEIIVIT